MIGVTGVMPVAVGVVTPETMTVAVDVLLPPVPVAGSVYVVVTAGSPALLEPVHATLPTPLSIVHCVASVIAVHVSVATAPGVIDAGVAVSATPDGAMSLLQPQSMRVETTIANR